jgi:glycosyltransferase involved in cell wall biosynthesis
MIKLFFWRPKELNNFQGIIYSASEQIYDTWPAYFFKKKNPKKITWVTAVHWLPPWPPWKRKQSKWYNSIAFFLSERLGLLLAQKKADLLFPVSQSTAEQLKTIGLARSRYQVVECGVDYNTIQKIIQDVKTKKYQAIFLKRLQSVKGIFDLIDIWKMVVKKIPSARLAIIGEGIDSRRARELVQQKNLTNHIDFLGNIYDFKEKFKLLAQSQLFLLPTYEENWAIVIGEAMASNLPVIAYKLKELDQVWQDNYLKIPKGNKNLFAQQVVELLRDINQRQFWQNKGHQYVQRYDWTLIAQKELKLIESIR